MQDYFKKYLGIIAFITIVVICFTANLAFASAVDATETAANKVVELFGGVRNILFVLGGFGIIGMSAASIFGNLDWKWAGTLALGLTLLAISSSVIEMMTGVEFTTGEDTLKKIGSETHNKNFTHHLKGRKKVMVKYTKDHEWVVIEGNIATVGISNHAQHSLGDLVYVELPAIDKEVAKGEETAVVESVKAASDVYSPLSGKIIKVNEALEDNPDLINQNAEGDGWMWQVEISNPDEINELLEPDDYKAHVDAAE